MFFWFRFDLYFVVLDPKRDENKNEVPPVEGDPGIDVGVNSDDGDDEEEHEDEEAMVDMDGDDFIYSELVQANFGAVGYSSFIF